MTSRTAAIRYARALIDVATKESVDLDTIGHELGEFLALLNGQPALKRVLMNPAVPALRKKAAVTELTRLAKHSPMVSKLLALLAESDRLMLLPELVTAYQEMLMARQNVVRAEIVSAEPLAQTRVDAIEKRLAALTGKRVTMVTRIDKEILGGVVARVGSTVYDASLATQLKKIRERLVGSGL
jgi:F-type H+-transporting ATPase subunit delta